MAAGERIRQAPSSPTDRRWQQSDFSDHTTERNTHLHLNLTLKTDGSYDGAPLPRCSLSKETAVENARRGTKQRGISTTVKDYFRTIDHKPYCSQSRLSCHTDSSPHTETRSHTNSLSDQFYRG